MRAQSLAHGSVATPTQRWVAALHRATVSAPDRLVLALFWTALVVSAAVLVGAFRPVLVLPVTAIVLVVCRHLTPTPLTTTQPATIGAILALALALGWALLNVGYASRYVVVTRDPGFLTLEAFWLADHPDPAIPVGAAGTVGDGVLRADTSGAALGLRDGLLHVQGAKLLPGLLAMLGWAGGDVAILVGNLAIGALGLLAVYGLARRMVGPLWALLPVVALAVSMPMTVFSRAAYTEPLALALAFGGMTMIWAGFESRVWWRHVVGAAMVGSTALVRIDGAAVVIGLVAGFGLVAGAALAPRIRGWAIRVLVGVVAAGGAMAALGYLDLVLHSPVYLSDLLPQYRLLTVALAATVIVSLVIALPRAWDRVRAVALCQRATLGWCAAGLVVLVGTVLITRPLWMINHNLAEGSAYSGLVAGLQAREGLTVDGTRSYDEMSVTWLAWYFGWPMVIMAFAGLAIVVRRAVIARDPRWLVTAAVIAAPSALYLWRVSITPDQIWAMRRLLPVTMPGFLVLACVSLVALWTTRRVWARAAAAALAVAVAVMPAAAWNPDLFTRIEQGGRLGEARAVCAALPTPRVVIVAARSYVPTLRVLCDAETIAFAEPPSSDELAEVRKLWGEGDIGVVTFNPEAVTWQSHADLKPFRVTTVTSWDYAISHIPDAPVVVESHVFLGVIAEDGLVVSLPPASHG